MIGFLAQIATLGPGLLPRGARAMDDKKSTRFSLDELARQLAESVPHNLKVLGQDLERNFKTLLQSGIERMELVSREEFDVQRAVLERTRAKLEAMEARLADLEKALSARS
jgi:BMFP domain-containing protein YqiC